MKNRIKQPKFRQHSLFFGSALINLDPKPPYPKLKDEPIFFDAEGRGYSFSDLPDDEVWK